MSSNQANLVQNVNFDLKMFFYIVARRFVFEILHILLHYLPNPRHQGLFAGTDFHYENLILLFLCLFERLVRLLFHFMYFLIVLEVSYATN